jgi:hypothetical protein
MEKFELYLDDDYFLAIGKITVNFATLEQMISFFIWNLVESDESSMKFFNDNASRIEPRKWIEFLMSTRIGLEKMPGKRLGQIVTAELAFRQKLDLLSSLFREKLNDPNALTELESMLKKASVAEEKRNTITHSFWTPNADLENDKTSRIKTTVKRKDKGLNIVIKSMSVPDLEDTADFIANVTHDVQTQIIRYYNPSFSG